MYEILPPEKITESVVCLLIDIMESLNYNNALHFLNQVYQSPTRFNFTQRYNTTPLIDFASNFRLDFNRFMDYLFFDLYSQGIDQIDGSIVELYQDSINMQHQMYGYVKYKYPDNLKVFHDQLTLKFNLHKQYFQDRVIFENSQELTDLRYTDGTYSIIIPVSSQNIIDEGINNHHCVGSYIDRVVNNETNILFMRKNESLEDSLITLEYFDSKLFQSKGLQNRHVTDEENEFLIKWMRKNKIKDERSDIEEYQRFTPKGEL